MCELLRFRYSWNLNKRFVHLFDSDTEEKRVDIVSDIAFAVAPDLEMVDRVGTVPDWKTLERKIDYFLSGKVIDLNRFYTP